MSDIRKQQVEALETLTEFNERLLKNMNILVQELSGGRLEDTDTFLNGIVDAINWEIEVVNLTIDLLNEKENKINKQAFNDKITELGMALKDMNDEMLCAAFKDLIPMFELLGVVANEVVV